MQNIRILILILTILIAQTLNGYSQYISEKEWDDVIGYLVDERWDKAEKLCLTYLKKFPGKDDSLAEPAIIRYMYLRCVGAQLGEKKYSKKEALKKVKPLTGRTIITPPIEFRKECIFNCISLSEDSTHFSSCGSNSDMTIIQTFETYEMADSNDLKRAPGLEGKSLRMGAFIKSIDAGGYAMPRLDVTFDRAFIWEESGKEE